VLENGNFVVRKEYPYAAGERADIKSDKTYDFCVIVQETDESELIKSFNGIENWIFQNLLSAAKVLEINREQFRENHCSTAGAYLNLGTYTTSPI
jgi:hypothetical protein